VRVRADDRTIIENGQGGLEDHNWMSDGQGPISSSRASGLRLREIERQGNARMR
jgi:hypothetical protein